MSFSKRLTRRITYVYKEFVNTILDAITPQRYLFKLFLARILCCDPTVYSPYSIAYTFPMYYKAFRRAFDYCDTSLKIEGDILEFGTFTGFTARILATLMRERQVDSKLFLFDSFEGLPEIVSDVDKYSYHVHEDRIWAQGVMQLKPGVEKKIFAKLSKVINPKNLKIIKGYYKDTLAANLKGVKAKIIHIDCDLYESAKIVLDKLIENNVLQDGTLVFFDDYNTNRANSDMGERKVVIDIQKENESVLFEPFFNYGLSGQAFFVHIAGHN